MFKNFRKRVLAENLLRGFLYGLSIGLLVSAILITTFLLTGLDTWLYFVIIAICGVASIAITMVVYYFIKKPTENDVAKRVDKAFDLKERAATYVAYQNKSSLLIDAQRKDAIEHVKGKKARRVAIKLAALNIPALLIGASLFTTSIFTNDIKASLTTKVVQPGDNFDDETDEIIDEIKDIISKSEASAAFKEELMKILNQLKKDLEGDTDINSRAIKVRDAIKLVDEALDRVNTKEEIGRELAKSESHFKEVGLGMVKASIDDIKAAFELLKADSKDALLINPLIKLLTNWSNDIDGALTRSRVSSTDAIYQIFSTLSTKFKNVSKSLEEKEANADMPGSEITKLLNISREQVINALDQALKELTEDVQTEINNSNTAEEVKKMMEALINPSSNGGSGNSGENSGQNGSQEGDGSQGGSGDQQGDQGNQDGNQGSQGGQQGGQQGNQGGGSQGEGSGEGQEGNGNGSGQGQGEGEGNGSSQGEGASSGNGSTQYGSNDEVYTGDGKKEYGDVLSDYKGDATNDGKDSGDSDLDGAIGDYFDALYGDSNKGDTTGGDSGEGGDSGTKGDSNSSGSDTTQK